MVSPSQSSVEVCWEEPPYPGRIETRALMVRRVGKDYRHYFAARRPTILEEGVLAGMQKLTIETSITDDGDHRSNSSRMHPQANLFHNVPYMPSVANVDLTHRLQSAGAGKGTMATEAAKNEEMQEQSNGSGVRGT
jgi:hypothetical protein